MRRFTAQSEVNQSQGTLLLFRCGAPKPALSLSAGAYICAFSAFQHGVEEVNCEDDVDLKAKCVLGTSLADVALDAHAARDGARGLRMRAA
eukprot:6182415-Pleurochrysis_carterae.AAC.1